MAPEVAYRIAKWSSEKYGLDDGRMAEMVKQHEDDATHAAERGDAQMALVHSRLAQAYRHVAAERRASS